MQPEICWKCSLVKFNYLLIYFLFCVLLFKMYKRGNKISILNIIHYHLASSPFIHIHTFKQYKNSFYEGRIWFICQSILFIYLICNGLRLTQQELSILRMANHIFCYIFCYVRHLQWYTRLLEKIYKVILSASVRDGDFIFILFFIYFWEGIISMRLKNCPI